MIKFIFTLYYKYKLGLDYDKVIGVAERFHYAITDFTVGGRGYNTDSSGGEIRARYTPKQSKASVKKSLSMKYPQPSIL